MYMQAGRVVHVIYWYGMVWYWYGSCEHQNIAEPLVQLGFELHKLNNHSPKIRD